MAGRIAAIVVAALVSGSASAASPLLEPNHWAVRAVERLEQLGLVTEYLPAQRAVPVEVIARALEEAQRRAPEDLQATVTGWNERFHRELPRTRGGSGVDVVTYADAYQRDYQLTNIPAAPPPFYLPERAPGLDVGLGGGARAAMGPFAASIDARMAQNGAQLRELQLLGELGGWSLSVGRFPVGYGSPRGAVLSGRVPLERVALQTTQPFRLPGAFAKLGLLSVDTFVARLSEERHPGNGRMWGLSVRWKPHPRLILSAQRATLVGTHGDTLSDEEFLPTVLVLENGQENNLVSASGQWRLPTESLVPLTLYGEWGADDSSGNHLRSPGIIAGVTSPALPGLRNLAVGGEFAFFGNLTTRRIRWYQHFRQRGGWASEDLPLGHELGGVGREFRGYATLSAWNGLLVDVHAFRRTRFADNLYAPSRDGHSLGGSLELSWAPFENLHLRGQVSHEVGDDWRETQLGTRLALSF